MTFTEAIATVFNAVAGAFPVNPLLAAAWLAAAIGLACALVYAWQRLLGGGGS